MSAPLLGRCIPCCHQGEEEVREGKLGRGYTAGLSASPLAMRFVFLFAGAGRTEGAGGWGKWRGQ